jgi:hypothetical protein
MVKLPPSIRIGFRTYDVTRIPDDAETDSGDALLGRHRWQGEIGINLAVSPEEIVNSVIHEVLHGIVDVYNFPVDKTDEEEYVRQLCGPLTALIRDNPDVIKWMVKLCQTRDTNEKTSKVHSSTMSTATLNSKPRNINSK